MPSDFAPHNMTSNTAPSPYWASASTENSGNFRAYKAFDNAVGTNQYWLTSGTSTGWLQIYVSDLYILDNYSIRVNTIPEPNRAPRDWTLLGSMGGSEWDVLDTVTGQTGWTSGQTRNFTCDTITKGYRFFRINVTANNGDAILQIGELYLYGDPWTQDFSSTTYTFQPDATSGSDAHINNLSATTNYGTATNLLIGETNANADGRDYTFLIKFDLSSIPSTATIIRAIITLYMLSDLSSIDTKIYVYRVKRDWVESQVTWNIYKTGSSWSSVGYGNVNDRETTAACIRDMAITEATGEKQFYLNTSMIQEIVSGSWVNNGFWFQELVVANGMYEFGSSDNATSTYRPKITIEYTLPFSGGTQSIFWN